MDTPNPQDKSPSSPPEQYEFTTRQNAVIGPLAKDMVWVAIPLEIVGILYGIGMIVSVIRAFRDPHFIIQAVLIGLAMLFYLALGIWTTRSARAFKQIVSTQGQDINHLMDALDNLRRMYGLLSLIVKIYVAVAVVAVVVGLIALVVSAFKG
jgi:hypothetical protein